VNLCGSFLEAYLGRLNGELRLAAARPDEAQRRTLRHLLWRARDTWFGRRHRFAAIRDHADFARAVPVGDYAGRLAMFQRILAGEADVSWPGRVRYFARTSGTTVGRKYIPLTDEGLRSHARAVRSILAFYARQGRGLAARLLEGKLLFLGSTASLEPVGPGGAPPEPGPALAKFTRHQCGGFTRRGGPGALAGDLSGIRMARLPWYARPWYEPGLEVARIRSWNERIEAMARRTLSRDVRFLAGIATWIIPLFDRLCALRGVPAEGGMSHIWPNLQVYAYGGMHLGPYRPILDRYFAPGRSPRYLGTYTASEGSIAIQAEPDDPSLELLTDNGLFYEFVPAEEHDRPGARRLTVGQVQTGVPYAIVLSTCAGLWAQAIDDVVRFTSLVPPRIVFVGRHSAALNAFAEHVGGHELAEAVGAAARLTGARVLEFTVAPRFPTAARHTGAHQFVIEFEQPPAAGLEAFAREVDRHLLGRNRNYLVKREGDITLTLPEITPVPRGTFQAWMASRGKLGGQNKVPVCASDRRWADGLLDVAARPACR
jgi:hypothetical protein